MMNFKVRSNCSGFMLFEVLVTIAVIGVMLTPIFILQSSSLRSVYRYSRRIRMLLPAKTFLINANTRALEGKEDQVSDQQQMKSMPGQLIYTMEKVSDQSDLKELSGLYRCHVLAESTRGDKESIIGFIYKPDNEGEK